MSWTVVSFLGRAPPSLEEDAKEGAGMVKVGGILPATIVRAPVKREVGTIRAPTIRAPVDCSVLPGRTEQSATGRHDEAVGRVMTSRNDLPREG